MAEDPLQSPETIPMSAPDITEAERSAVLEVLHTNRLSMGPEIERFEQAIASWTGSRHAIAVSSGTAGLHLCVRAAGIRAGDLVLTTPFSFVASANVILYEGAIPVFVDVDPGTGNIDPEQVAQAAEDLSAGGKSAQRWLPRKGAEGAGDLKALLPVDVFGQPADYDPLQETCRQYELLMIEDSCESLGSVYAGRPTGVLGDMGVFAFYPNKQITTAEGGMVVADDENFAGAIRAMRNQGRALGDTWLEHTYLGYNYRLDELSAALGRVQMQRLDELLEKRTRVADWYLERFKSRPFLEPLELAKTTDKMSWFVFVVRLHRDLDRKKFASELQRRGVPTRPYFVPIHTQPYYIERFGYRLGDFPVTDDLGTRSIALPFSGVMDEAQVEYVVHQIDEVVNLL